MSENALTCGNVTVTHVIIQRYLYPAITLINRGSVAFECSCNCNAALRILLITRAFDDLLMAQRVLSFFRKESKKVALFMIT